MAFSCRLIFDLPREGAANMAIDELLLRQAADQDAASLRFYLWRTPTLSLGYFQSIEERDRHLASRELPVVRRVSGGGALVHDLELTYALCLPSSHPLARRSRELYWLVHDALVVALASWGVAALRYADLSVKRAAGCLQTAPLDGPNDEPFLCFQRRACDDVVTCGATDTEGRFPTVKVCGSAQRRRRNALLQHGSVLLGQSVASPELPGLKETCEVEVGAEELAVVWGEVLAAQSRLALKESPVLGISDAEIESLVHRRFSDSAWTRRR